MNIKQYLQSLFLNNPFAFILLILFFIINISLNIAKIQITPFFAYGMYSKVNLPKTFHTYEVYLDGQKVNLKKDLPYSTYDFLSNRISFYDEARQNNFVSNSQLFFQNQPKIPSKLKHKSSFLYPTVQDIKYFPIWLSDYLKKWYEFDELKLKVVVITTNGKSVINIESNIII